MSKKGNVQAVLFDRTRWSTQQADKYLQQHSYTPMKAVHITSNKLRYRLQPPGNFKYERTEQVGNGVELLIGFK